MTPKGIQPPQIKAQKSEADPQDWKAQMMSVADASAHRLAERRRARNPMIPDNFLDFSDAGFPSDLIVKGVQIPRPGVPQEMANYQTMLNLDWQHVKWEWISKNGGMDGKAVIPAARQERLGSDGQGVAVVGTLYLMFANRAHYEERRSDNREIQNSKLLEKVADREEQTKLGPKGTTRQTTSDRHELISFDDVMEIEKAEDS